MQVQNIQNLSCNTNFGRVSSGYKSLRDEISGLKTPTVKEVKDLYGTFGLDIYEGKQPLTILSKEEVNKSKKMISKIKSFFTGKMLHDYQEGDTLKDVILKYAANEESGLVKDIETKFGKRGMEVLEAFGRLGYINL